ncbi:hypothetical protein ACLOJK_015367 [Asimina triloba]
MAVATTAVSLLVGKLREELSEDIILLRGARAQMEWVETEFRRMECFLKDADGMEEESETTKNWTQEVRDLAYRAEDAIDIFFLRIEYARQAEGCWGQLKRYVFILNEVAASREVASEVEWMKQRLRSISESRGIYSIPFKRRGGPGEERRLSSPQHHPLHGSGEAADDELVGFGKEVAEWVGQLTADAEERRVLSIVGMAGLGKSTVANKLYNENSVKQHFPVRAWVFVSPQWSLESIYDSLGSQIGLKKMDNMAEERARLVRLLTETRYLIVVDDVWDNKDWDDLADLFPVSKKGSRIILTTRNEDVARRASSSECAPPLIYKLQRLSEEDSRKLFEKKAMAGMREPRRVNLKPYADQIVGKCDGVPLAIVSIAGVLAGKVEESAWEHASKSISYLLTEGEQRTSGILHLSYRYLPYQLKPCFLYLAGFPEEVRARKLIRMWAAEGLLEERGEESLEDVGEDCLLGLVQRSLVRVVETSSTGGIKSCCIHSLQHRVALSEAKTDKFLQVQHHPQNSTTKSTFSTKARRLAIHGSSSSGSASTSTDDDDDDEGEEDISISGGSRGLRSVLIYPRKGKERVGKQLQKSVLCGEFKLLRVLDLQTAEITEVPSQICRLVHLRYLALTFAVERSSGRVSGDPLPKTLPGSIDKLRCLQTLECYYPFGIRIPSSCSIQRMRALRHVLLKSPYGFKYGVVGLGASMILEEQGESKAIRLLLRNLRTLTNICAGEWLKNLKGGSSCRLRKLGITVDSDKYYEYVANLVSLQSLSLSAPSQEHAIPKLPPLTKMSNLRKLSLTGLLEKLPEPHEFPLSLSKLTLESTQLEEKDVGTLGNLNNLRILRLMEDSYKGTHMTWRSGGGFPTLECLHLEKLAHLEKLKFEEAATPKLSRLHISLCEKMSSEPEGVEYLKKKKGNFKMVVTHYGLQEIFEEISRLISLAAAI